jgi:hypothetical protein
VLATKFGLVSHAGGRPGVLEQQVPGQQIPGPAPL